MSTDILNLQDDMVVRLEENDHDYRINAEVSTPPHLRGLQF